VPNQAKGVLARFVSVGPATAAKASSDGWRLCLRPNTCKTTLGRLVPLVSYSVARVNGVSIRVVPNHTVMTCNDP
jgi:hypothetical protein